MIGFTRGSFFSSARVLLTAALGVVVGGQAARADLTAYDSFSYTPGTALAGQNGGTGFSGAWAPGSLSSDGSNSYYTQGTSLGGSTSAGGRVASLANYSLGNQLSRTLSQSLGGTDQTVYISVLLRPDGTLNEGSSGGFFGLNLNASTTTASTDNDVFIGKTSGSNYGIEDRGGNNSHLTSTAAAIGVSTLLVVRADLAANGNDKFTLYVNPTATSQGPATVKYDSNVGTISSLSIYGTGAFSLDELRIGTTLADVVPAGTTIGAVPEPASIAMLSIAGLGVAALARARRRPATA